MKSGHQYKTLKTHFLHINKMRKKSYIYQIISQQPHKIAWIQDTNKFLHLHGSLMALGGGSMNFATIKFEIRKNTTEKTTTKKAILWSTSSEPMLVSSVLSSAEAIVYDTLADDICAFHVKKSRLKPCVSSKQYLDPSTVFSVYISNHFKISLVMDTSFGVLNGL